MTVFNLVFGAADDLEIDPVTVAISAPANDDLAQVLTTCVAGRSTAPTSSTSPSSRPTRRPVADRSRTATRPLR